MCCSELRQGDTGAAPSASQLEIHVGKRCMMSGGVNVLWLTSSDRTVYEKRVFEACTGSRPVFGRGTTILWTSRRIPSIIMKEILKALSTKYLQYPDIRNPVEFQVDVL
ncbi:UNVERIFIED_CONTAM: hypothetical protein HHA_462450 [Hammondia hammondi]|eukprot:XP_008886846.1 hypothetical protein HHA_462450 [Hammondia hammondi]